MLSRQSLSLLHSWFQQNREPYFFRENRTPYKVWISEVIFQQTKIQAGLPSLKKFLETFPTLESLANAREEEVLVAWKGLGYYNRARNLHKGAHYLLQNFQGQFPENSEKLQSIPSIGSYTASAISSLCFGEPSPAIDGNLRRILARTERWALPSSSAKLTKLASKKLKPLYHLTSCPPGDLNEAFMELGQKICLPKIPLCKKCPLQKECQSYKKNEIALYPKSNPKKEKTEVIWKAYLIQNKKGEFLLQKWQDFYFLKDHWAFPSLLIFPKTNQEIISFPKTYFPYKKAHPLPPSKHTITHHKIALEPYILYNRKVNFKTKSNFSFKWICKDQVSTFLVASAFEKIWKKAQLAIL